MTREFKINCYGVRDTSIYTHNLGDEIIMDSINQALATLLPNSRRLNGTSQIVTINSHSSFSKYCDVIFVGGTNLLSGDLFFRQQWKWDLSLPQNRASNVLVGVGWKSYSQKFNMLGKLLLKSRLSSPYFHSVRDEFTKKVLAELGVKNVINTGCPTTWTLDREHCSKIPNKKGDCVLLTLTDYNTCDKDDQILLDILLKRYCRVFFWPQGLRDLEQLHKKVGAEKVTLIEPSLRALDGLLADESMSLDYVGTRLHCGIRAMRFFRRSIIISIDNRATEISADMNLPTLPRRKIEGELETAIERNFVTSIKIPMDAINEWQSQFSSNS